MSRKIFELDPEAKLDFAIDWTDFLEQNETITNSTWVVTPSNELVKSDESSTNTKTIVWLDNGTRGREYVVANKITTSAGREDRRSFVVRVTQKFISKD